MIWIPSPSRSGQSRMPFGIALADQEHDRRRVRRAVVRQARLPRRRQPPAHGLNVVDVPGERQSHDVGIQAVDDGARLAARAAVRHLHRHLLPGVREPLRDELLVQLAVQLARRVVRDVQDLKLAGSAARPPEPQAHSSIDSPPLRELRIMAHRDASVLKERKPQRTDCDLRLRPIAAADEQHRRGRLLAQQLLQIVDEIAAALGRAQPDHQQRLLVGRHEPLADGVRRVAAKRLGANVEPVRRSETLRRSSRSR